MTKNQLLKSIDVLQGRINKTEKLVEMYRQRREKALIKANKHGHGLSIGDFSVTAEAYGDVVRLGRGDVPFSVYYPIVSSWEMILEKERILARYKNDLEDVFDRLNKLHNEGVVDNELANILAEAMKNFRKLWFDKMIEWHKDHHAYINAILDVTVRRKDKLVSVYNKLGRHCGFWMLNQSSIRRSNHGGIYISIGNEIKNASMIISDQAAGKTLEEYLAWAKQNIEDSWSKCMRILIEKLEKFNINKEAVKVDGVTVTSKGFECYIHDGRERRIYARLIWAAEYSELVSLHTRYIITEKKLTHA